jgi:ubiquitin fusion degradation protein 1
MEEEILDAEGITYYPFFQKEYKCGNKLYISDIDIESDSKAKKQTNKVILSKTSLEQLTRLSTLPIYHLEINFKGKRIYSQIESFCAPNNFIIIPDNMMEELGAKLLDRVFVNLVKLPIAEKALFKLPKEFKNPQPILQFLIKDYSLLYKNQTISIKFFEKTYVIKVIDLKPAEAVCILNTDLKFDIEY